MISCFIVVQVATWSTFVSVAMPTQDVAQAQSLAAIHAGRMAARLPGQDATRFGFDCGDQGWVSVDLPYEMAFHSGGPRKKG